MQNKKRKTSTLEANRALFTADENALIDKLLECGQEHLFEHWPAPGDADEDKKRFMAQAATCDAGYPGGIASYVSNALKLLEDSKLGVNPFDGWTPSVPDGIVVDYASAEHKKLEQLGMQEIGSAAFVLVAGGLGERLGYSGIKGELHRCHVSSAVRSLHPRASVPRGGRDARAPFGEGRRHSSRHHDVG